MRLYDSESHARAGEIYNGYALFSSWSDVILLCLPKELHPISILLMISLLHIQSACDNLSIPNPFPHSHCYILTNFQYKVHYHLSKQKSFWKGFKVIHEIHNVILRYPLLSLTRDYKAKVTFFLVLLYSLLNQISWKFTITTSILFWASFLILTRCTTS